MNIGNKIINKEEAKQIAMNEMTKLENKYPESMHNSLWDFHREMVKIESRFSQRVSRWEKKK
jgi:hypothetical protein